MSKSMADRRSPLGLFPGQPMPRLYDCVVEVLCTRHCSRRTEEAYLHWIRRFLLFHNGANPRELAETDRQPFPHASGGRRKRSRVYAESGIGGGAVPLRARAGTAAGPNRRSRAVSLIKS
jgi:hypothetical protein